MTLPTAASRPEPWTGFLGSALAAAALAVLAGAAATISADPLWVFRESPPWVSATGGVNRLLDVEMRRAKALQLRTRAPATVLLGSSVVYRGLDPADAGPGPVYNLGLSSLMAAELPEAAELIAAEPAIRCVVIGLDAFMFTDFPGPPPLRSEASGGAGRLGALLSAALSLRSLAGVAPSVLASAYEPGSWRRDGFKETPDYPPAVTARLAAEAAGRRLAYRPESLAALAAALDRLGGRDLRLYLSPQSAAGAEIEARALGPAVAERWRRDVAALAASKGVPFQDLSSAHPFRAHDPAGGSSAHWLDHLHFKPEVGLWILRQLGRARADAAS